MQKKTLIITAIISALLLPIISAYSYWGIGDFGYYSSPLYFLENEWVMFLMIFLIFFATIFYTLFKAFKNKAIAAIISLGLAFLISTTILQRGLIESYGGGEISSWALFLAGAIGIAFLIKFASESFGKIGTAITVFLIWLVLSNLYPEELLPELLTNIPAFMWFWEVFIIGWLGLLIFEILALSFGGGGNPREVYDGVRNTFRR